MEVGIHESEIGLYRPPVLVFVVIDEPPQIIISAPVHTAVCPSLDEGQSIPVDVGVQLFKAGVYLPPVFMIAAPLPQIIISVPVQTADGSDLGEGRFAGTLVGTHESLEGLYRPPLVELV